MNILASVKTAPTAKEVLEAATRQRRFNMKKLLSDLQNSYPPLRKAVQAFEPELGERLSRKLASALIRNSFLIEAVLKRGGATKMLARWELEPHDPRYAPFEACDTIFQALANNMKPLLGSKWKNVLTAFLKHPAVPYELPVDYLDPSASPLHSAQNIGLFIHDAAAYKTIALRSFLLSGVSLSADVERCNPAVFPGWGDIVRSLAEATGTSDNLRVWISVWNRIFSKVKTKSYLTDRAQTGEYKTNREKRWETHPHSPQFATRKQCMRIEFKLLNQALNFEGFPSSLLDCLVQSGVAARESVVCPITLDPFSFTAFAQEAVSPQHGLSNHHIGHLVPLKSGHERNGKHTADNISWISEDGNRIQGPLTLSETRALLRRIWSNYKSAGLL